MVASLAGRATPIEEQAAVDSEQPRESKRLDETAADRVRQRANVGLPRMFDHL